MRPIFLYKPEVVQYDYGQTHPFRLERLWLTEYLCRKLGLFGEERGSPRSFSRARREDLLVAHEPAYLDVLEAASSGIVAPGMVVHGLGMGDNPVFSGLWEYSLETVGGTLAGARLLTEGKARRVFHPGGGLHHARRSRAAGFCYANDVVVAIDHLLKEGRRVFYLDLDAHHGDGVEQAFFEEKRVLTFSIHQDGRTLFPGSGFVNDLGGGEAAGWTVNVPLLPGMTDESYHLVWEQLVVPLLDASKPDVLVTELGADALLGDPLASLALRLEGWWQLLASIAGLDLTWLAVGGGGYDMGNTMRAWTMAWAAMVGWEPGDSWAPPPEAAPGLAADMPWPPDFWSPPGPAPRWKPDEDLIVGLVRQVRELIFPYHGLSP